MRINQAVEVYFDSKTLLIMQGRMFGGTLKWEAGSVVRYTSDEDGNISMKTTDVIDGAYFSERDFSILPKNSSLYEEYLKMKVV